jgi:hypothetical protein
LIIGNEAVSKLKRSPCSLMATIVISLFILVRVLSDFG